MRQNRAYRDIRAVLLALLIALALAPGTGAAQDARGQPAIAAGEAALRANDPVAAERHFRRALRQGASGRDRVIAEHGLASAMISQRKWADAEAQVLRARADIIRLYGADDILMARNWRLFGTIRYYKHRDVRGAQQAFRQAARIRNARVDAWRKAKTPGGAPAVRHTKSGLVMPLTWGGFRQTGKHINNDAGTDVAINYVGRGPSGQIKLTVYVYKADTPDFGQQFKREIAGVRSFNARLVERRAGPVSAGARTGRMALFSYQARAGEVATRLYLFPVRGGGLIKFRVTHLAADNAMVDATMVRLLALVGWPA